MRYATTDPGGRTVKVCRQPKGARLTFRFLEQSREADLALRKSLSGVTYVGEPDADDRLHRSRGLLASRQRPGIAPASDIG